MFTVTVKVSFKATHALRGYYGKDELPHSHEWQIAVAIDSLRLDESGCAVDFAEVDRVLAELIQPMSDRSLNSLPAFKYESPSAENIARHVYRELSKVLNSCSCNVTCVTVWEDENHSASYYDEKPKGCCL